MSPYRRALVRRAIREALRVRAVHKRTLEDATCVYDLADEMKLQVEFKHYRTKDYEGIYLPAVQAIHLEPERPAGRQRFTCAHELGHHVFGHGQVAQCSDTEGVNTSQEELLANTFASFLLMPKIAVMNLFARRGTTPAAASDADYYVVAGWMGVGFTNLVYHCHRNLEVLPATRNDELQRSAGRGLGRIRDTLLQGAVPEVAGNTALYVVPPSWQTRPLDLAVGDHVLFELPIQAASPLRADPRVQGLYTAVNPGTTIVRSIDGSWAIRLRVYDPKRHGWWRVLWDIEEDDR